MTSAVSLAQSASADVTTGFKNRLINSDFSVWQRGTSVTFTSGAYTADMWIIEPRSSQSCTISQSTDVPSGQGFGYSGRFTATGGALQGFHIRTAIENPAAGNYGEFQPGTTWTFSLWARSAFAGVAITPIFFLSSNAISNPNASVGLNGGGQTIASTWTRYTWTVTMPSWVADAGSLSLCNQLTIRLLVGAGSQDLYITGAQMEPGTVASSFDRRPVGVETILTRRYYQTLAQVLAVASSANTVQAVGMFPVRMRATPTVGATGALNYQGEGITNSTQSSIGFANNFSSPESLNITVQNFSGLTQGRTLYLAVPANNTNRITLSAEL
jgi:hypothetical protein